MPEPVTPPANDLGLRRQSVFDLEKTLVVFLQNLFDAYRLDNPTLNLAQTSEPSPPVVVPIDPDQPPVSYDYTARAQTLALKVPPTVSRGRVPRTVTGAIAVDQLPDHPSITVQAVASKTFTQDSTNQRVVTVQIFFNVYDENPNSQGYQDAQNMLENAELALTSFGLAAIDQSYPIVLPLEWQLFKEDTFPHFIGEMTTQWQLPAGSPMPGFGECFVPGEHLHMRSEFLPVPIT